MHLRNIYRMFFAAVLLFGPIQSRGQQPLTIKGLTLDQVMDLAKEQNPDIKAARQSWKVSQALIAPSKSWSNPTFTYIDEKFPGGMEGAPAEKVKHYRLEQMVPFPGKPTVEGRMKYHESLIAESTYQSKIIEILGEVRIRYYKLYLIDEKIALTEQSVEAVKSVLQTAQSRLASGQSTTTDVFTAQIELRKMENMLFQEKQERILAQVELNTLLSQSADTEWGMVEAPELIDLPVSLEDLKILAKEFDPLFREAMHETNHAQSMLQRNRLEFAPDFEFMYELETKPNANSGRQIGIGVNFPLWLNRPWSLYKSSKEHFSETEAMADGVENTVMKMVHTEFVETITYLTLARNYKSDILPIAQSNLKIAREQYASGRGDFLQILGAFRTWIEAHNEYQEQLYHYGEHRSFLERWVGIDLNKAPELLAQTGKKLKGYSHEH